MSIIIPNIVTKKEQRIIQQLLDGGLLKAIETSLTENYEDPDTVVANMSIIKQIVTSQPKLAQQIANENVEGIQHSIQSNQDNPKVLSKILDALHSMGKADGTVLKYLTKAAKIEDSLIGIVQSQAVSHETTGVDSQNIMIKLKELGLGLNQMNRSITESQVKDSQQSVEPDYSTKCIAQGTVGWYPGNIQVSNPSYYIVDSFDQSLNPMIGQDVTSTNDEKFDCDTLDAETLFNKLKPSPGVPMDPTFPRKITERLQGGDEEIYNYAIQSGGLANIMSNAYTNMGNPLVLNPS